MPCGSSGTKAVGMGGSRFLGLMAHAILETILKKKNTKLQMQSQVRTLVELWLDHSEGTPGEIIQGRRPGESVPCSLYWAKECV